MPKTYSPLRLHPSGTRIQYLLWNKDEDLWLVGKRISDLPEKEELEFETPKGDKLTRRINKKQRKEA